jgi:hypothetical protein
MISVPTTAFLPTSWTYEPIRFKGDITKLLKTFCSKRRVFDDMEDIEIDPGKICGFKGIKKDPFDHKFYLCVNEC